MAKGVTTHSLYHFRLRPEVKSLIARLNISQIRLARKAGISGGYLSQLLGGQRFPGPDVRQRLLDAIPKATFDELFEEVDS